ncbi:MAG: LamG domain-containing protein [Kiritimatiellae bacterium]|nr:LamG domain-containing protein [Kiritimatiellia bacterium]
MHAQGRSSRFAVSIKTGAVIGLFLLMGAHGARAADAVLSFSASGQRVVTTGQITANDFTAEAWFKLSSYISENQIFSQYRDDAGRFIVGIKDKVAGMFIGGTWMTGSGTIPLNTWTHIAVSRSNTTWTIYINGQFYTNGVHNANPLANTTFAIGAIGTTAPGFRGEISDVRAWNTVRSQAQIAGGLDTRLTGTEAGLAHYWPLNEGLGSTVADLAAGASGTLGAGVAWAVSTDLPFSTARQDGTVAYWRLDADASGTLDTRDFIGNARLSSGLDITAHTTTMQASRNQAFSGQPPNSTLPLPNGNSGSAYAQANGACLRVTDLGRHLEITNSFTVEGWIAPHRQDYDTDIQYIANTRVFTKGWAFALKRMSDGTRRLVIYAGDDSGVQVGDASLSGDLSAWADTWRHVALVYDATAGAQVQGVWRCYLDGELQGAATNQQARVGTTASEYFHLAGRIGGNPVTFCGYLDCWRVSQAALVPEQFLNATDGAVAATDVLALWPLNSTDGVYFDGSDVTGNWSFGTPLTALHKATGSTSQAVTPLPNPDASAAFRGDPAVNTGSLVFNTPAAAAKRAYLASDNYTVRDTLCYTNSFTLEGWFYRTLNPGGWQLLFATGGAPVFSNPIVGLSLNFTYRTNGYVLFAGGGWPGTLVSDVSFGTGSIDNELNVWRHVALVYDVTVGKGTWSLYVDGTLKGSIENNTVPTRSVPAYFYIGGRPWSDNAFNGAIDTVRLTRGVLAPSQFLNAAGAPPPAPPAPATVAYWKLDDDGAALDAASQVEPRYGFALDAFAPAASAAQFKRFVPVPDTTAGFIGDPRANAGSAACDGAGYLCVQNLGNRVELDRAFTIEGWMFWSNQTAHAVQTIAGTRFDATYGWRLSLEKNGDAAAFRLFCRTPNQTPLIDATFAFDAAGLADAWHHLALTFTPRRNDTGTWELFVDGVSVGTLENIFYPAVPHRSHWFALGGQADGGEAFDGLLDCWRVSEGARTPDTFLYLGYGKGTLLKIR